MLSHCDLENRILSQFLYIDIRLCLCQNSPLVTLHYVQGPRMVRRKSYWSLLKSIAHWSKNPLHLVKSPEKGSRSGTYGSTNLRRMRQRKNRGHLRGNSQSSRREGGKKEFEGEVSHLSCELRNLLRQTDKFQPGNKELVRAAPTFCLGWQGCVVKVLSFCLSQFLLGPF